MQLKKLKLRKDNLISESYRFDEVFTEYASQKRVYEAVAKPVVEGVLNGYNGTIMAYGQTGTGKTYTLGKLVKDDASKSGFCFGLWKTSFMVHLQHLIVLKSPICRYYYNLIVSPYSYVILFNRGCNDLASPSLHHSCSTLPFSLCRAAMVSQLAINKMKANPP
ncbi:putative plus-end-directed kinesin ATPase [Helianthus annuus]|nr:putative plus-end-directed kinesin ATPase [Helianthus annuus]